MASFYSGVIQMRSSLLCLVAFVLLPSAHAVTLTIEPTNGNPTFSLTFDPSNPAYIVPPGILPNYSESDYYSAYYNLGGSDVVSSTGAQENSIQINDPAFYPQFGYDDYYFYYHVTQVSNSNTIYGNDYGPVFFTGDASAPVFVNGTYHLFDLVSQDSPETVIVSGGINAAPEPSALLLLASGALAGCTSIRRRIFHR
jgi:hypothetical protein